MTNVNNLLNKLFGKSDKKFSHKENFTQSPEEEDRVRDWSVSAEGRMTMIQILKSYQLQKSGIQDGAELYLLTSPYANGFAIPYDASVTEQSFRHLFFAFGLRMLDLGYYRVSLDRTLQEVVDHITTTEKQYFKPSVPFTTVQKTEQLYGNVSIEKLLINNKPSILKVLVTIYSDHQYHDARPFDQFMKELLKA